MPLAPGTSLGPYQIVARVGAGGMGEVYRAVDTRLDRVVAIKVCRERFSDRFEREARACAALNHPHICQLYDVGPDYLVMEFVDGKPVSGPLPLSEVLRLAGQIADALGAAHDKGLVHRDLKPDNILVTKAGDVKLLDFGLAKSFAAAQAGSAGEVGATRTMTEEGTIVGTLQYMSPEQLQGAPVDGRSDIFSFGAVLYELLTGRRAFDGANRASVIAAILRAEPQAISEVGSIPQPAVDAILRRSLAKEPAARWQSVRDLAYAFESFGAGSSAISAAPPPLKRSRMWWLVAPALVAVATLSFYASRRAQPHDGVLRFTVATPASQYWHRPVISPDGSKIAFVSGDTRSTAIWVRSFSDFEPKKIIGAENTSEPIWSPDSKFFVAATRQGLSRFGVSSDSRQVLYELPRQADVGAGSWSVEGDIILSIDGEIVRVPAAGSELEPVTHLNRARGELIHTFPQFLPGGRRFLYQVVNQREADNAIYQGSLDSEEVRLIVKNAVGPFYVVEGYLIFSRAGTLMAQQFEWKTSQMKGDAKSLGEHVYSFAGTFNPGAAFSATAQALAYFPTGLSSDELVWFDRSGRRLNSAGAPAHHSNPALSPDGRRIAVGITDPTTNQRDIWVLDETGGRTRFTSDPKDDFNPAWSPDGTRIAFSSDRKGVRDLYTKPLTGNRPEELLLASAEHKHVNSWSPDGKLVTYNGSSPGSRVFAVPVEGDHKPIAMEDNTDFCDQSSISPDGHWIAWRCADSTQLQVFVKRFQPGGPRWQLSTDGGGEPSWRQDGKEIYFARDKQLFAVDIKVVSGNLEHGAARLLFSAPFAPEIRRNRYVPSNDGQRFLIITQAEQHGLEAHVVLNWESLLKRPRD